MVKRRKRLLSMALAVGLLLSSLSPYSTAMASQSPGGYQESESTYGQNQDQYQQPTTNTSESNELTQETKEEMTEVIKETNNTQLPETEEVNDTEYREKTDEITKESQSPVADAAEDVVPDKENDKNQTQETAAKVTEKAPKAADTSPKKGLYAEYYTTTGSGTNIRLNELKSKGIDYNIDFSDLDPALLTATGQGDFAGIKWTGSIQVPKTGNYTFYGLADNGIRVWVDNKQIINYWDAASWDVPQTSASVKLEAGRLYEFKTEYFDAEGGSHATLSWSSDTGIDRTAIPSSAFFLPEDYSGTYVEKIDVSEANLNEGADFNGNITVKGQALNHVKTFEAVRTTGESLAEPCYAQIVSQTAEEAKLVLPSLKAGTYKLKAISDDISIVTKGIISVKIDMNHATIRTERPRANWERDSYVNLNGAWEFGFDSDEVGGTDEWYKPDKKFDSIINVPFCWESELSGISDPSYKGQAWYKKTVSVDNSWKGKKIFLKFGAVDWKCKLWVNGKEVGEHIGGYSPFEMDVTEFMNPGQDNVITLWVEDRGSYGDDSYPALIGKQGRNAPCGYTHTSGIWQTVGMEARNAAYLDNAKAASDIDNSTVTYTLDMTSDVDQELTLEYDFASTLYDIDKDQDIMTGSVVKGSQKFHAAKGTSEVTLNPIVIENQKLWNYNSPNLYQGTLTVKDSKGNVLDTLSTYFGLRKIETKYYNEELGVKYIYINNAPVHLSGLLDQGFWEDGIYTAPSEEALKYDITAMKEAGFNMIRKHLKIEDPLQYYWCDKLGMLVWQDMPHATAMVPTQENGVALGRQYYEECLETVMNMNYNHPSIISVMLFNETWGLNAAYDNNGKNRLVKASDGMNTAEWVEHLFNKTKELNPNMLVEDMSACNNDHVQPTELNTYHFYPNSYDSTLGAVENRIHNAYPGSKDNFQFGNVQDGDPLLNSEYGGVGAGAGDYDVSYCFKYMTDIQRRYEKQSGFVYTEPYDVEYERNGILTYDRQKKVFGYEDIAYGGDMGIQDLTQDIYIGIVDSPIKNVAPGQKIKTKVMALAWTYDVPEETVVKWRFDGTDIYGNSISTDISGRLGMDIIPYEKASSSLSFKAPTQACVGTLTVWIEGPDGEKLAKNFINIVVNDDTSGNKAYTLENKNGSVTMKAAVPNDKMVTTKGAGAQNYTYQLPENFELSQLEGLKIIAEASSYKGQIGSDKFLSSFSSEFGQTAAGRERATDMTVSVNGVEIDTMHLPDNPRDMRGTLSLNNPYNGATSAGDFGYLVNLNVTKEKLSEITAAMGASKTITVTYSVKEDAANQNGLRIYNSVYGRYAVNPTIILNPKDIENSPKVTGNKNITTASDNYSVEGILSVGAEITTRNNENGGYVVSLGQNGTSISVVNKKTNTPIASAENLAAGAHDVKVTLFDEQIRVYVDGNAEPVINVYDRSGFTGGAALKATSQAPILNLVVSPESYEVPHAQTEDTMKDVNISDDFSNPDYTSRYEIMGNAWSGKVEDGVLNMSADRGDKLIMKDTYMSDGIYELDVTMTRDNETSRGNAGFVFRGKNFALGADGADGYYAGIGQGYVQLGRMNQNWTELARAELPELKLNTTHTLTISVFGSRIQIYVDHAEKPCIDIIDTTYPDGSAAIRGYGLSGKLDNVKVVSIPEYICGFEKNSDEWEANGNWKAGKGVYTCASKGAYSLVDSDKIKDFVYASDLVFTSEDSAASLLLRVSQSKNGLSGYQLAADARSDKIQLIKTENGKNTVLSEAGWQLKANTNYRLTAEIQGGVMKVYVGDSKEALLIAEDAAFESGQIGVMNISGSTSVDNVAVNGRFIGGELMKPAVTAALDQAIADAKKVEESKYTPDTYAKLKAVLAAADINRFDQKDIDKAVQDIKNAMAELKLKPVDLSVLNGKIAEAKRIDGSKYTPESYGVLKAALAKAEAVNKNDQNAVDAAAKALGDAILQLKVKPVDVSVLNAKIAEAKNINASKYTAESYAVLKSALAKAESVNRNDQNAVDAAVKSLSAAIGQLKLKPAVPKKNASFTVKGIVYKVTKSAEKNGTVKVMKANKKTNTSITIPNTIKVNRYTFKVTEIYKNAFKSNKKLKTVKIGDNVSKIDTAAFAGCAKLKNVTIGTGLTSIGSKAFEGDKELKSIVIKSSKLKKVSSKAFKGINKNAYINVPNKKAAGYKKLFKNAGQEKTVKIK